MTRTTAIWAALLLLAGCDGGGGGTDAGPPPEPDAGPPPPSTEAQIPAVTGTCPDMTATGVVTFSPAGIPPRDVQLYVSDAAATADGPLVFYWHGAGSQPREAEYGMGSLGSPGLEETLLDAVQNQGGIVAAPFHDPNAGDFPWYLTIGREENDLVLADEILACAVQEIGVDTSRIHAMGMSAGGLHTSQMALRRASYLASVAIYSGGLITTRPPPTDDPNNRLPVLMFHGGETDVVVTSFQESTERLWTTLDDRGHVAVICDHGRGHTIPVDAQWDVRRFLEAHPYGTVPSPWQTQLPADYYEACALTP